MSSDFSCFSKEFPFIALGYLFDSSGIITGITEAM
jgi:hypothetical protein